MIVSGRERLILQYLMDKINQEVTIKELADFIRVSERTIHRDLKNIEDILEEFNLPLSKRAGVGIKITGDKADLHQLRISILKQNFTEYTPDERMIFALCTLLDSKEPIKLLSLATDMFVTTATVSNDLDKLEPTIKKYGLLLVRRRGYGIELEGSEDSKRKAIRSLISDRFDVPEFLKMVRENIQKKSTNKIDSISERLLGLVQKDKILIIENIIDQINDRLPYSLADSSYVGLVVHLALAIERIQRGENITIRDEFLSQLKVTKEYQFAGQIAERLQEVFETNIPDEEIGYITMHLRGAKFRFEKEIGVEADNVETAYIVQQLIEHVGKLTNVNLKKHFSLSKGLLAHLQPTLYRISQKMRISNPLLTKIKSDYAELFSIVKEAVALTLPDLDVPEEEIGYLVLHFGSALNNQTLSKKLRVLIICSSGIGTSKMLAAKINNLISGISELKSVSVFELKNIQIDDYDAILSTIPIEGFSKDYLLVSPIVTDVELENIKAYFSNKGENLVHLDSAKEEQEALEKIALTYEQFKIFTEHSISLVEILESFELYMISIEEREYFLQSVINDLFLKGSILSVEEIIRALKQRELLGGLGIPGTKLALFHARSDEVQRPSFNLITLDKPQILKSMDNKTIEAERILLILAREDESRNVLEIMSYISALIIQSKESIEVFESASRERLIQYISNQYFNDFVLNHKEEL